MKTKIKNIFNNIKNYLNKDLCDKRWKWFIRFFLILIISIYIGAVSVIGVVGLEYVQDKINNIENSEQVEILDDKNITMQRANSVNTYYISPIGSYEYLYFNISLSSSYVNNFLDTFEYILELNGSSIGASENKTFYFYPIFYNASSSSGLFLQKIYDSVENKKSFTIEMFDLSTFSVLSTYYGDYVGWQTTSGVVDWGSLVGNDSITFMGQTFPVGNKNNLLGNIISPTPFLFEGDSQYPYTSSGITTTKIDTFYINNKLTNQTIKNNLDNYLGNVSNLTIEMTIPLSGFLLDYNLVINNNSANAYIYVSANNAFAYLYIYDSIDFDENVYWYGINPLQLDNNLIFDSRNEDEQISISYDGSLDSKLNWLFSDTNDFEIDIGNLPTYEDGFNDGYDEGYSQGKIDGYNEGYQAGSDTSGNQSYNAGFNAGTTNGINIVQTNANRYGLYTQSDLNNAIASAEGEGLELGIQQVIENPNQYNLYTQEQYENALNGTSQDFLNPVFSWLEKASGIMSNIFSVELFPGVTLGILVLLPLIFALFFFILKLFFGG